MHPRHDVTQEEQLHSLLTAAPDGDGPLTSGHGRLISEKWFKWGLIGPRTDVNALEKKSFSPTGIRSADRQVHGLYISFLD
jgi:hypothetical protein